jgi:hypothetical protein
MSKNFQKLAGLLNTSEAQNLLGRKVEIIAGEKTFLGVVSQVVRGEFPLVMVDGQFYDLDQVSKVLQ